MSSYRKDSTGELPRVTSPEAAQALRKPPIADQYLQSHQVSLAGRAHTLVQATRPRQWLKNVLVFAAPAAAGSITHLGSLERSAAAFGIFVAASASTYLVNDVVDFESDQHHPVKGKRSIASGALSVSTALSAAVFLGIASVGAAALVARPPSPMATVAVASCRGRRGECVSCTRDS